MKVLGKVFRIFTKVTGFLPFLLVFKPKVFHENKKNKARIGLKKAIILCNHSSITDYFLYLFLWPFRCLHFIAGEIIYKMPVVRTMSSLMGNIRIDRTNIDMGYFKEASDILKHNGVVCIFPEGHFVKKGKIEPFKTTAVRLALETSAPIVMVYQDFNKGIFKRN